MCDIVSDLSASSLGGGGGSETGVVEDGVERRRRVAVYGGSFDPITDAHLKVMAECIHSQQADEVWVVPCGGGRKDKNLAASGLDRLIMAHQAVDTTFGSRFPVFVKDVDVFNKRATPTYYLLKHLQNLEPEIEFYFVVGSDLLPSLRRWDEGERLVSEYQFLIMERPGFPICTEDLPENYRFLTRPDITISITKLSSSEIRKRIRMNISLVDGLIPSPVLAHIIRNRLYERALPPSPDDSPITVITPVSSHAFADDIPSSSASSASDLTAAASVDTLDGPDA